MKVRVLIVDDHEMLREGLRIILGETKGIEIIGEAANGAEALKLVEKLKPDVVLMNIKMPVMNGIECTKQIRLQFPFASIVILSSFDEESLIRDCLNAGARGYLLKNASRKEVTNAIFAAYRYESYYSSEISLKLGSNDCQWTNCRI